MSETRTKIERALTNAGFDFHTEHAWVYTDRSQSGWRIKYAYVNIENDDLIRMRKALRDEFPTNDVRVWHVVRHVTCDTRGLAIKVYN